MYFDTVTLTRLLSDAPFQAEAAAAIAAARRRFTSPLAVAGAILALRGQGGDAATLEARITDYLDGAGIELRDMPPSHRLIEAALASAQAGGGDLDAVLHGACAAYYEAEPVTPEALLNAAAVGPGDAPQPAAGHESP